MSSSVAVTLGTTGMLGFVACCASNLQGPKLLAGVGVSLTLYVIALAWPRLASVLQPWAGPRQHQRALRRAQHPASPGLSPRLARARARKPRARRNPLRPR